MTGDQWVIKKDGLEIDRYEVQESDVSIDAEIDVILETDLQTGYTVEVIPVSEGTTQELNADTTRIDIMAATYNNQGDEWTILDADKVLTTYTSDEGHDSNVADATEANIRKSPCIRQQPTTINSL